MKLLTLLLLPLLVATCNDEDNQGTTNGDAASCSTSITIQEDGNWVDAVRANSIVIHGVEGTCIDISYAGSGCSEEEVRAKLVTNGAIAESHPTQTSAALVLDRQVGSPTCMAYWELRDTFDLAPYIGNSLPTRFTLEGTEKTVLIE